MSIVHFPKVIQAKGEVRTQYAHAIDMVPTVLEVLGIEPPESIRGVAQSPLEGVSFAYSFNDGDKPTQHHTQYFEMFATRAIDHDGWRAVCGFPGPSYTEGAEKGRSFGDEITAEILDDLDANSWELYHLAEDPAEVHNLSEQHPEKLREMISRWYVEAGKYQVLPLDGTIFQRLVAELVDDPLCQPWADALYQSRTQVAPHTCRGGRCDLFAGFDLKLVPVLGMVFPAACQAYMFPWTQLRQIADDRRQVFARSTWSGRSVRMEPDYAVAVFGVVIRDALHGTGQRIHGYFSLFNLSQGNIGSRQAYCIGLSAAQSSPAITTMSAWLATSKRWKTYSGEMLNSSTIISTVWGFPV